MKVHKKTDFENYQCLLKEQLQRRYQMCTKWTWYWYSTIQYRCVHARLTFSCVNTQKDIVSTLLKQHIFQCRRVDHESDYSKMIHNKCFETILVPLF